MREEWITGQVDEKELTKEGEILWKNSEKALQGDPVEGMCNFSRKFEERAKKIERNEGAK